MKTIACWNDLAAFGITPLTGEACGLGFRLLCDVTDQGKRVLEKCFDVQLQLAEPWNRGAVGSIMLTPEMLVPVGVFALLESGCTEVWRRDGFLTGIEPSDTEDQVRRVAQSGARRYRYGGTAGSRNRHEFTGRVT